MTRQRDDDKSTEFGLWLREQDDIGSGRDKGFVATNVDYIWRNYVTGDWMLLEEKRHDAFPEHSQLESFMLLNQSIQHPKYHGFFLLQFSQTSPDDGVMWLDCFNYSPRRMRRQIVVSQLIEFLQFKPITPTDQETAMANLARSRGAKPVWWMFNEKESL